MENLHTSLVALQGAVDPKATAWLPGMYRAQPLVHVMLLRAVSMGAYVAELLDLGTRASGTAEGGQMKKSHCKGDWN